MARAAWLGSKICWFQRSYESPALLVLLKSMFSAGVPPLKDASIQAGLSEDEFKQLLVYSAGVFMNCGNYLSFGDTKFLPQLT
jgi:dipeptidyl-peptidase-3